jgi:hypothetical protein
MKIDFYPLKGESWRREPDVEHELPAADAIARARCGQTVLVKIWLRTDGVANLEDLEQRVKDALAPVGLV